MTLPILVALTALIAVAHAQEPVSGRIESIDDSAFPEVRAIVTLIDEAGRPIAGLNAADFTVEETGAAAQVSSVETVLDLQLGVAVILVVDTSGSMDGAPIVEARNAAQSFVENLAENDEAAIVSFADDVVIDSALTSERSESLAAISELAALGNTALYSGVVKAVEQARDAALPRKAIILLSDGQDFGGVSQDSRQESLDLAAEARVPIYAIGLGQDIDRPYLEELAAASGGSFIEAPAPNSIPEIYEQLSELLRSQYVVSVSSTALAEQADRSLKLTVTTPAGQVALESSYTTRRTIAAPTTVPVSPTVRLPVLAPATTAQAEESGGGGVLLPLLVLVFIGAGTVAVYLYYQGIRRQRTLAQQIEAMSQRAAVELDEQVGPTRHVSSDVRTHLVKVSGPELEQTFEIGAEPVVIGTDGSCPIQIPASAGVSSTHARLWVREGTLMLHHLAPGYESLIGGRSATWVTLESSDEVHIGPYVVRVES